jgi:hypothetical protein
MTTILVDPISDKNTETDEIVVGDIELDDAILDIVHNAKGQGDVSIREILLDAVVERTMEGASNVTFTVHDPVRKLLNSGALDQAIDIYIDKLWWRLTAVNKNDSDLDLVFEDREVAWIRQHDKVMSASRKDMSRAEFCVMLIHKVKGKPKIVCPELHKTQKIHSGKKEKKEVKDRKRELGIADTGDLKVWYANPDWHPPMALSQMFTTRKATNAQIDIAEQILDAGYKHHPRATEMLMTCASAVGMVETGLKNTDADPSVGGSQFQGVFQQTPQYWTGLKDVSKAAKEFFDVAIKYHKEHPDWSIEEIAVNTQRPSSWPDYRRKVKSATRLAKDFVDAYGAADLSNPALSYRQRYMFTTKDGGKKQDWWTAIGRLMTEVGWARFMSNGVIYLIAETDLLKSKIRMRLSEDTPGVQRINFNYDVGHTIAAATVTCRADRWIAPPGTVVELAECGPADGRWLVSTIRRSLFNRNATIELKKPTKRLGEPASELIVRQNADTDVSTHHGAGTQPDKQDPNWHPPLSLTGKVTYRPGANNTNDPLHKDFQTFLALIAGQTQEGIRVNTGTNHGPTVSGGVSNHQLKRAADLNVDYFGGPPTPAAALSKGNNILIAAYRVCGLSYREAKQLLYKGGGSGPNGVGASFSHNLNWRGHSVEFGWQTFVGGNHFNHVHVGFDT